MKPHNKRKYIWVYVVTSIIIFLFSVLLWKAIKNQERYLIEKAVFEKSGRVESIITNNIESSVIALQRMAQRWEIMKGTPKPAWKEDAKNYVEDNVALTTVEWVDENYQVRWVEPLKGNEGVVGLNIAFNEEREKALQGAAEYGVITLTQPLDLVQGYRAFIAYVPIHIDGVFNGFIVGIYNINEFINSALPESLRKEINIKIYEDDKLVFVDDEKLASSKLLSKKEINLFNRSWQLEVAPKLSFIKNNESALAGMVLVGGLFTALFVGFIIYYALTAKTNTVFLEQKADELEKVTRLKSEFLANMSHEIRTPMNGVMGMTQLLMNTKLSDEQKTYAQTVYNSAEALLDLINDILDFSKIEAGKLELESLAFDFKSLVEDVTSVIALKCHEKGLDIFICYDPKAPRYVIGDPGRIRQVLLNLLSNALKFTKEGYILVSIKSMPMIEGKVQFKIEVEDTGEGVAEDKQEIIFNKFDQADQSTARKFGGTGLGLAICKELTAMMGGKIGIKSQLGKGTKFWFTILLAPNTDESTDLENEKIMNLKDANIIIVDNSDVMLEILSEQLKSFGANVMTATTGKEAMEKMLYAKSHGVKFKVLITGHKMLDMTGIELGSEIKKSDILKDTAIIMNSSSSYNSIEEELKTIGFDGYVSKPVFPSEFPNIVSSVLSASEQNEQMPIVTKYTTKESSIDKKSEVIFDSPKILLAEDNRVNQMVAVSMLEEMGCDVTIANNGFEAIKEAKEIHYDLVLMDCQMPELDGYEATKVLKKIMTTPVIAFTANATKKDLARCKNAGMDDHISKPVQQEVLKKTLAKFL